MKFDKTCIDKVLENIVNKTQNQASTIPQCGQLPVHAFDTTSVSITDVVDKFLGYPWKEVMDALYVLEKVGLICFISDNHGNYCAVKLTPKAFIYLLSGKTII